MGIKRSRFEKGVELIPEDLTLEDLTREGEVAYDSDTDKLKYRNATTTKEVANTDEAQTFENKVVDGTSATGNNTVTTDADQVTYNDSVNGLYSLGTDVQSALDGVKTQLDAQNDASEIAYDNSTSGLTATDVKAAIDEVDGRVDTIEGSTYVNSFEGRTGAVTAQSGDYDANQVTYSNATSGLTATDAQAAIDEVEGRLDTAESNISSNDTDIAANTTAINNHINDTTDAHDASAISYSNATSGLAATEVQSAIDEVDGRVDTAEAHIAASSDVHGVGVGNDVVGTGTSQVLTDKDIDGGTASNTSRLTVPKDTKLNLDSLTRKEATVVYSTDQSKLFVDNGTDLIPVGSGEGTGSYNYIENGTAELNADGWTVYANTTAGSRPDNFGGTPAGVTFTRSETNPLVGDASFVLSKDAADRQGSGVYYEFDVEGGHETLKHLLRLLADTSNANIADGDLGIFLVMSDDNFTSDFLVTEPNNPDIKAGFPQIFKQLQFTSGKTKGRLCIHIRTTKSSSYTAKFDQVIFGPHEVATGSIEKDWKSYTPEGSWTTNTTYYGRYKESGDSVSVRGAIDLDGAPDATPLTMTVSQLFNGLGFDIDDSKLPTNDVTNPIIAIGEFSIRDLGTTEYQGTVYYYANNQILFAADEAASSSQVTSTNPITFSSGDSIGFSIHNLPIVGKNSSTASSEDLGSRDVVVSCKGSSGQTVSANTDDIVFDEIEDNTSSWDGSSFTAPESAYYIFSGMVRENASSSTASLLYIDNSLEKELTINNSSFQKPFSTIVYLNKGQVASIRVGSGITVPSTTNNHHLHIQKLSSAQTILETETVAARYTSNSGQTITGNIEYEDKDFDTHNAYNTSNGEYIVPVSGYYYAKASARVTGITYSTGQQIQINIIKDSVSISRNTEYGNGSSVDLQVETSTAFYANKGAIMRVTMTNSTASESLNTTTEDNVFSIARIK